MRLIVFLVSIWLFSLSGDSFANLPGRHKCIYQSQSQNARVSQPVKFRSHDLRYLTIDDNGHHKEDLIAEEDKDEDENVIKGVARKCTAAHKGNPTRSYIFVLSNLHNRCGASRPFYSLSSDKYIFQRTLRI